MLVVVTLKQFDELISEVTVIVRVDKNNNSPVGTVEIDGMFDGWLDGLNEGCELGCSLGADEGMSEGCRGCE